MSKDGVRLRGFLKGQIVDHKTGKVVSDSGWIKNVTTNEGLTNIALYFQSEGKTMHHATVIHLVKMYPMYKRYNSRLASIEESFEELNSLEFNQDSYIRNQYLSYNYDKLQEKYKDLKDNIKTNPILDVLQDIPEDKIDEVIERINILKKSWDWKSKDKCKVIEASTSMEGMSW